MLFMLLCILLDWFLGEAFGGPKGGSSLASSWRGSLAEVAHLAAVPGPFAGPWLPVRKAVMEAAGLDSEGQ